MYLRYVVATLLSVLFSIQARTADAGLESLGEALENYVAGKDARIGVAVIVDGKDTVSVNGNRSFPMMSVFKFPQALAVADYCRKNAIRPTDSIAIGADEIKENTWSPMREKYGISDMRLPLEELIGLILQQSDNNASDVLFRLVGGPAVADSLMKANGFDNIEITSTENDMHRNPHLCYGNLATPIAMAELFDRFYRGGMWLESPMLRLIGTNMLMCATGRDRLPAPLTGSGASIGHKTGSGDTTEQGRIMALNDAGYIFLPEGNGYAIAVFIADSAYDMTLTASMIADISAIVFNEICKTHNR